MNNRNGFFQVLIKEDGIYLKLYEAEAGGNAVFYEEISAYLTDKKIFDFPKTAIGKALTDLKGTLGSKNIRKSHTGDR